MRKYQTGLLDRYTDYDDAASAIKAVEAIGGGSVVCFNGDFNLPDCLPKIVWRSSAMWVYEDGKWWSVAIHTGTSFRMGEEKPS